MTAAVARALIVEADGGSRGNPGPAGFGAVVADARTGEVLAEVAEAIGRATNNVAEYRGLLAGLRAAVRIDPTCRVEVRMDSKLVVEQMSGRWQIKHPDMRDLAAQVRGVLPSDRVRYTWVPRAQNARADRLANEAMDAASAGRSWSRQSSVPAQAAPGADCGPATVLLLVRHGRTELTEQRRMSGTGGQDAALSALGQADADRLAQLLAGPGLPWVGPVQAVVSSPLRRARQTAAAVADRLGLSVTVLEGWAEACFGDWDGLTFDEIARGWPQQVRDWRTTPDVRPPGGESLDELAERVRAARRATIEAHRGQVVVVVTHGGPIRVSVREALDAGSQALWRTRVDPVSVTVVRYWSDGGLEVGAVNLQP